MTNDKEKLRGYFHCDMTVRKDASLTDISKLIFGDIAYFYFFGVGKCTATNSFFAKKYGKSEGTVSNAISKLVNKGYIVRFLDEYKNRTIYLNRKVFSKDQGNVDQQVIDQDATPLDSNIPADTSGPLTVESTDINQINISSNRFAKYFNDGKAS